VIATGFDRVVSSPAPSAHDARSSSQTPVIPFPNQRPLRTTVPSPRPVPSEVTRRSPMPQPGAAPQTPQEKAQDLNDMEIPTFIRRQMD
jgi:hypothetical protein